MLLEICTTSVVQRLNSNNTDSGTERCYWRFVQPPHCAANCLQHARSSGPGTMVYKSHATHTALSPTRTLKWPRHYGVQITCYTHSAVSNTHAEVAQALWCTNHMQHTQRCLQHTQRCLQHTQRCLQHARSSGPGTMVYKSPPTHTALIMCNMLCAAWY